MTDERILRLPDVKAMSGLSRSAIYRKMRQGEFPQAVKLGPRAVGWRSADVRAWLQGRPPVYGE